MIYRNLEVAADDVYVVEAHEVEPRVPAWANILGRRVLVLCYQLKRAVITSALVLLDREQFLVACRIIWRLLR